MLLIIKLLDILHLLLLFHPLIVILFFNYFKNYLHFILLISVVIPLHWVFFNNECILTNLSKKIGGYKNSSTDSEFSENNLQWLYKPIMKLLNLNWNSEGLNKMVHLHWFINFVVIWYLQNYKK